MIGLPYTGATEWPRYPCLQPNFKRIDCACGHSFMITLGELEAVECLCGQDYDPRTGKPLPVCEGFEITRRGPAYTAEDAT